MNQALRTLLNALPTLAWNFQVFDPLPRMFSRKTRSVEEADNPIKLYFCCTVKSRSGVETPLIERYDFGQRKMVNILVGITVE
ncbi:hypothetical protein TNCV_2679731 [Trichonephila clavipes]|nr:hypothetical protein TNCV_2679731 [Trichonephila clavipes]